MMKFDNFYKQKNTAKRVGIYAGKFKPPTLSHFKIAKLASEQNDIVEIIISPVETEGITSQQSFTIWNEYKKILPNLNITIAKISPITTAYILIDKLDKMITAPNTLVNLYCSKEDIERYVNIEKMVTTLKVKRIITPRLVSASYVRKMISKGNQVAVFRNLPDCVNQKKIWSILTH